MASTYSDLKFELIGTGEQSGVWGTTTNDNIGTAIEQALVGLGNPIFTTDANLTISLTNTVALQTARALVLNATSSGSLTATRELVVPTIEKQYIVQNNTTGGQSITVKTTAGTGITVTNGRKAHLYVDGVNVIQMFDFVDINGGAVDGTPIGASSASTGAFTTLAASGAVTLSGGTANGVAYLNGSKVLTSGSALTFDGTVLTSTTSAATAGNFKASSSTAQVFNATASNDANTTIGLGVFGSAASAFGMINAGQPLLGTAAAGLNIYSSNASGAIKFGVGSTPAEGMRLNSTGLGIGTSSPSTRLDVSQANAKSATGVWQIQTFDSTSQTTGVGGGISFSGYKTAQSAAEIFAGIDGYKENSTAANAAGALRFHTQVALGSGLVERMRIDSSGNVGIGQTSMTQPLEIKRGSGVAAFIEVAGNNNTPGTTSAIYGQDSSGNAFAWNRANFPLLFGTSNTEAARITSGGALFVGITSNTGVATGSSTNPGIIIDKGACQFQCNVNANQYWSKASGYTSSDFTAHYVNNNYIGGIQTNGTITIYATASDYRLKTVIGPVLDAGQRIDALKPVEYTWNSDGSRTRGFLAHQFQEVYAASVSGTKDAVNAEGKPAYQAMQASSSEVIADLVAELQSLRARVEALESN